MSYKVLHTFIEKEHEDALYVEGETYPKAGFNADPARVAFLQSNKNEYKKAFLNIPKQKAKESTKKTNKKKVD